MFLNLAKTFERMLAVAFGKKNYVGSSPTVGIFLYVANSVERVLAVSFGNKLRWFESHCRHISDVAKALEPVLAVAFGNKIRWFEIHC